MRSSWAAPDVSTFNDREAVAALALLAMYSDGVIAPEEDATVRERLGQFPLFEDMDDIELGRVLAAIAQRIKTDGDARVIAAACTAIPAPLRPTAFLLAAEVIASDGEVLLDESQYLARLEKELGIGSEAAMRIREVTGLRLRR